MIKLYHQVIKLNFDLIYYLSLTLILKFKNNSLKIIDSNFKNRVNVIAVVIAGKKLSVIAVFEIFAVIAEIFENSAIIAVF